MRKIVAVLAACTMLLAGTPAVASASPVRERASDLVSLAYGHTDANMGGKTNFYRTSAFQGPCDSAGYTISMSLDGTSSLGPFPLQQCNAYVAYAWFNDPYPKGRNLRVCGSGIIPTNYVGNACNDKISRLKVYRDVRYPTY